MLSYRPIALIDNDALANLTHVPDVFNLVKNLFKSFQIPMEVKNEYARMLEHDPSRRMILEKLRPNEGFWSLCTELDIITKQFLLGYDGIDEGEAELASQGEKKGIRIIISDDQKFKNSLDSLGKNFLIVNSLYIIAALDINEFILNTSEKLKFLYIQRPFKSKDLRSAYLLALKEYGLNWSKKKISEKTSLKKLGLKN